MTSREIRRSFLEFFERHGHRIVASSSLVPADDPTLLFTNAGMNQFKDVFLGKERRDYRRAASSQKCMRVSGKHNDLDNVGPSLRHHTFFEMLGNFSFGDYFKVEAIEFAWTLLTEVWGIPSERLYATVFCGEAGIPRDTEAYDAWTRVLPRERIGELGREDNFWSMGDTGPCGRCSEIHFHRGDHLPCRRTPCLGVGCDCDRYVEIWNNVFMEFDRGPDGTLSPLPAPSIDTGMGLERVTAVLQDTLSNYDTDLFQPLLSRIAELVASPYGRDAGRDVSMRVIADHIRATSFLIADGIVPSNEWRGYVLRKIMRRAMRHGKRLGTREPFLHELVSVLAREMGDAYPELARGREAITRAVRTEEERFDAALTAGLPRLEEVLERAAAAGTAVPGEEAFRLYDSLGVPLDFIEDLAGERGLTVDRAAFDREMDAQRQRARSSSAFEPKPQHDFEYRDASVRAGLERTGDAFEGYTTTRVERAPIVALFDETRRQVDVLEAPAAGYIVLQRTPFYVESGGQVSDTGWLTVEPDGARARVEAMARLGPSLPRAHQVTVERGALRPGDVVTASVDAQARAATRRNHTATHLLHAALRQALGQHVKQAGSLVAPDRLRFDFAHFAALTGEELTAVERIVNEQIRRDAPVTTETRPTAEAMASGAMALFGEKYGDTVRVVSVPSFSMELCGGTHCTATGEIGAFLITQESGVAAGVRRLEAVTGAAAVEVAQHARRTLQQVTDTLRVPAEQVLPAIERLQADVKRLSRDVAALQLRIAVGGGGTTADDTTDVNGVRLVTRRVSGLERSALRELADSLRDRLGSGIVVLAQETEGKVALVASVSQDLTSRIQAGRLVKELAPIVGGGGGGRPTFAEAGGKDPGRIDDMLNETRAVVSRLLG